MKKAKKAKKAIKPAAKQEDLVLLSEVHAQLVLPGAPGPINRNSLAQFMNKLGIVAVRQRRGETGYFYAYITPQQAAQLKEDFERVHWRKFRLANDKK